MGIDERGKYSGNREDGEGKIVRGHGEALEQKPLIYKPHVLQHFLQPNVIFVTYTSLRFRICDLSDESQIEFPSHQNHLSSRF